MEADCSWPTPHFPWEGALRFWEVHLTAPGEFDVSGSQLSGLPGLAVGFSDTFAWTHTVSSGNRFKAYSFLNSSNIEDREAEVFADATRSFSEKNWKPVAFTPEAMVEAEISRTRVSG